MKNKTLFISGVILVVALAVLLFFWIFRSTQQENLRLYQDIIEKMKQGGKLHTLIPDLEYIQTRPFLKSNIRNGCYLLAAYIESRRNNHFQANRIFEKVKLAGPLFDVRDYADYWWGLSLWELYRQTQNIEYAKRAGQRFKSILNNDVSPMKTKALFDYIKSSYYAGDDTFYDAIPDHFIEDTGRMRSGDLPEFLYIMAEANRRQGNIDKACHYLVQLWKQFPHLNWGRQAEDQLKTLGKLNLIRYPLLAAGELLDIYDLQLQNNSSKASLSYLKERLDEIGPNIRDRQLKDKLDLIFGKVYYHLGPWKKADYYLSRAFKSAYPEIKVEAAYYLMRYASNHYYFSTLRKIAQAIDSPGCRETRYFQRTVYLAGFDFMRKQRYKEAIPLYQTVLKKTGGDKLYYDQALWRLHWCHYHLRQYEQALKTLNQLRQNPSWEEYALYWTAYIFQKTGKMNEAKTLYRQLFTDFGLTYYGILAEQTLKNQGEKIAINRDLKALPVYNVGILDDAGRNRRYRILQENGLYEFAAVELEAYLSEKNISKEADETQWKPYGSTLARLYFYTSQYIKSGMRLYWVYKDYVLTGGKNLPAWFWDMYYPVFYKDIIDRYADHFDVNKNFLYAFIRQESYYEPFAKSPAGAIGVMQIMPATARGIFKQMGSDLGLSAYSDDLLYKPEVNIPMGIFYLRKNIYDNIKGYIQKKGLDQAANEDFYAPLMIAGYNAGLSRVYRWLKETKFDNQQELIDQIDIPETRIYVKLVLKHQFLYAYVQNRR